VHVCVSEGHLRASIQREVVEAFPNVSVIDLTEIQKALEEVVGRVAIAIIPGVTSVDVHMFRRRNNPLISGLATGVLPMGRLEIARLDNAPNFPEHGLLSVTAGGGR